jgi:SAM-dependent methyltransferase
MWRRLQPIGLQVTTLSAVTFFGCLFCLGEVARLRPPPRELTHKYLLVSIGGVIGACFVTLVAPVVFTQWIELHVCLIAIWVLGLAILLRSKASPLRNLRNIVSWLGLGICTSAVIVGISFDAIIEAENRVLSRRSFYGVLTVEENRSADPRLSWRALFHNGTIHGTQFLHPDFRRKPTSYYDEVSGVGVLMRLFRAQQPRRVGVIGLGAGTVATYGKTGDTFVFYELDPDVIDVARTQFTFLNDSPANVVTIAGDARLSLSRQEDQHFDVLVLDAFSGDAIPVHLLTTEAFALYRRHLAPGGVIAIHLTNKHLDLGPVAWAVCKQAGLSCVGFLTTADQSPYPSAWALASEDRAFLHSLRSQPAYKDPKMRPMQPWTDDHAPLFPVFRHPWRSQ